MVRQAQVVVLVLLVQQLDLELRLLLLVLLESQHQVQILLRCLLLRFHKVLPVRQDRLAQQDRPVLAVLLAQMALMDRLDRLDRLARQVQLEAQVQQLDLEHQQLLLVLLVRMHL